MKKVLLIPALLCAAFSALADGTVSFNNWTFNYIGESTDATIISVAATGDATLDLSTPSDVTITGIRADAFNGQTTLRNITLPATLKGFPENPLLFSGQFIGQTGTEKHLDCGQFDANPNITINISVTSGTSTANSYNKWGNTLFTLGNISFPNNSNEEMVGNVQVYYTIDGIIRLVSRKNGTTSEIDSSDKIQPPFDISFDISNGNVKLNVIKDNSAITFKNQTGTGVTLSDYPIKAFNQFSYGMGTGMDANVEIINNEPRMAIPFGQTALESITIPEANTALVMKDGAMYYASDETTPAYRLFNSIGDFFTISNGTSYLYYNGFCNASGEVATTGSRTVNAAAFSNTIAPACLFTINSTASNGFKISPVNAPILEFANVTGGNLDACINQWSGDFVTTYFGEYTYSLTNARDGNNYTLSINGANVNSTNNATLIDTRYHLVIEKPQSITLTVNDEGYAATTLPIAISIPSSVKAYKVTGQKDGEAILEELTGIIPAKTPFIIYASETTEFPIVTESAMDETAATATSVLTGYPNKVNGLTAGNYLVFNAAESNFTAGTGSEAGLGLPYILKSALPGFTGDELKLPSDPTTAIAEISTAKPTVKGIYDLQGRRVATPAKGIYIINGKKTIIK